jgi:hypothetical protein
MFSDYPTGKMNTPLGMMDWSLTEENHAYLSNFVHDRIRVGQSEYSVSIHVWRDANGNWGMKDERPYIRKVGIPFNKDDTPAPTHKQKIIDVFVGAFEDFIEKNPELRLKAMQYRMDQELKSARGKVDGARKELEKAEAVLTEVMDRHRQEFESYR